MNSGAKYEQKCKFFNIDYINACNMHKKAGLTLNLHDLLIQGMDDDNRCIKNSGNSNWNQWERSQTKVLFFIDYKALFRLNWLIEKHLRAA